MAALQAKADASDAVSARIDTIAKDAATQIAALRDDLTARNDALKQALAALDARVSAIDKQALAAGVVGGNADAAVLDSLRGQLEDQRKQNETLAAQIADVADKANARIDAAEKQAAALKAEADATAKTALARAALTRVNTRGERSLFATASSTSSSASPGASFRRSRSSQICRGVSTTPSSSSSSVVVVMECDSPERLRRIVRT